MAMKKPIIGTAVGGISEVIQDQRNGFLVPPQNSDKLADAVSNLLTNRDKANAIGIAGYEVFRKNFSADVMMRQIENLYTDILTTSASGMRGLPGGEAT